MNVKTFLTGIVAFAAMTQVASAVDTTGDYRSKQNGNWTSISTWERFNGSTWANAAVKPDGSNPVRILHQVTVNSNEAADDFLEVTGTLIISGGAALTVDGDLNGGLSTINGTIQLGDTGGPSTGTILFATNSRADHSLQGTGSINGMVSNSKVQIASGVTLYSQMVLKNYITMEAPSGTGIFSNSRNSTSVEGRVLIDTGNAAYVFANSVKLVDVKFNASNRPSVEVLASGGSITFNRACDGSDADHPVLDSKFIMNAGASNCGDFVFSASVYTKGTRENTNGRYLASGAPAFRYDWVNSTTYTEIATCEVGGGTCTCP
jgi:hypothetical protein